MKLHLPHKLRAAVMASLVAFTGLVTTVASGVMGGGAFIVSLAVSGQAMAAAPYSDIIYTSTTNGTGFGNANLSVTADPNGTEAPAVGNGAINLANYTGTLTIKGTAEDGVTSPTTNGSTNGGVGGRTTLSGTPAADLSKVVLSNGIEGALAGIQGLADLTIECNDASFYTNTGNIQFNLIIGEHGTRLNGASGSSYTLNGSISGSGTLYVCTDGKNAAVTLNGDTSAFTGTYTQTSNITAADSKWWAFGSGEAIKGSAVGGNVGTAELAAKARYNYSGAYNVAGELHLTELEVNGGNATFKKSVAAEKTTISASAAAAFEQAASLGALTLDLTGLTTDAAAKVTASSGLTATSVALANFSALEVGAYKLLDFGSNAALATELADKITLGAEGCALQTDGGLVKLVVEGVVSATYNIAGDGNDKLKDATDNDHLVINFTSGHLVSGPATVNASMEVVNMVVDNGYSNGDAGTYTYNGAVTGSGPMTLGFKNQHHIFNGDMSGYTGAISVDSSDSRFHNSLTFADCGTVGATSITLSNDADLNISGSVALQGTLTAQAAVSVAEGAELTLNGDSSIASLTSAGTITNNGNLTLKGRLDLSSPIVNEVGAVILEDGVSVAGVVATVDEYTYVNGYNGSTGSPIVTGGQVVDNTTGKIYDPATRSIPTAVSFNDGATITLADGATLASAPTIVDGGAVNLRVAEGASATYSAVIASGKGFTTINVEDRAQLTINVSADRYNIFNRVSGASTVITLGEGAVLNTGARNGQNFVGSNIFGWNNYDANSKEGDGTTHLTVAERNDVVLGKGSVWNIAGGTFYFNKTTVTLSGGTINLIGDPNDSSVGAGVMAFERMANKVKTTAESEAMSVIAGPGEVWFGNNNVGDIDMEINRGSFEIDNANTADLKIDAKCTNNSKKLAKSGEGVLELTNSANNFNKGVDVNGGTLKLSGEGGKAGTGTITVAAGAVLELAHTVACATTNTINNNGTLTVTGVNETVKGMSGSGLISIAANAQMTAAGTIKVNGAIAVGANGMLAIGEEGKLDISTLELVAEGTGGYWQLFSGEGSGLLAGSEVNLDQFAFESSFNARGKQFSFTDDGRLQFVSTSHEMTWSGGELTWNIGAKFDNDAAFADADVVTFREADASVLVAATIAPAAISIENGVNVTLSQGAAPQGSDARPQIGDSLITVDGTLTLAGDVLAETAKIAAASTGGLVVDAHTEDVALSSQISEFAGSLTVESGRLKMGGGLASGGAITVKGGQLYLLSNVSTPITIAGSGWTGDDHSGEDGQGSLRIESGVNLGAAVTAKDGAGINVWSGTSTFSGVLSGEGTLTKLHGGQLNITGNVTHNGKLVIDRGTISYGTGQNQTNSLGFRAIDISGYGKLRIDHASINLDADVVLRGGEIWSYDQDANDGVHFKSLSVLTSTLADDTESQIAYTYNGRLTFDKLTGNSDLNFVPSGNAGEVGVTTFSAIEDYNGTLKGYAATGHTLVICSVSQAEGLALVMQGDVSANSFSKLGAGSLSIDGTLSVADTLAMNYEGTLEVGAISVADNALLSYTSVAGSVLSLAEENLLGNVNIDIIALADKLADGINLNIASTVAQDKLNVVAVKDYSLVAENGTWVIRGGSVETPWDFNWGTKVIAKQPATVPTADLSSAEGNMVALSSDTAYAPDGAGYTAVKLTGEGRANLIVVGGKNADVSAQQGTLNKEVWILASEGKYRGLVGGSYANNWGGGAVMNFNGDRHILVDGAEVGTIIGGSYKDGQRPNNTGDVYITIRSGTVKGSVIGGTLTMHAAGSTQTGNNNIFVYTLLNGGTASTLEGPGDCIIGANAYASNVAPGGTFAQIHTGNTNVVVDLSGYQGEAGALGKHIVGGNYSGRDDAYNQNVDGNTSVTVDLGSNSTAHKVVGGSMIKIGHTSVTGNSSLTINGGSFSGHVVGGSFTLGSDYNKNRITLGSTSVTINGGTFTENVFGAAYMSGSCKGTIGSTSVVINQGSLTYDLIGSAYLQSSTLDMQVGQTDITINGGSIGRNLTGGMKIDGTGDTALENTTIGDINITINDGTIATVIGGTHSLRNTTNGITIVSQGNITVNLNGGEVGDVFAAGYQQGSSGLSAAGTTVNLGKDTTIRANKILSGGYGLAGGKTLASVVTGNRVLNFTDVHAYDLTAQTVKDFDVISVLEGASAKLGNTKMAALTKVGAGTLEAALTGLTSLTVQEGSVKLSDGADLSATAATLAGGAALDASAMTNRSIKELTLAGGSTLTLGGAITTESLAFNGVTASKLLTLGDALPTGKDSITLFTGLADLSAVSGIAFADVDGQMAVLAKNYIAGVGEDAYLLYEEGAVTLTNALVKDVYWKGGTEGTWDDSDLDWSEDSAVSTGDMAFKRGSYTHFEGSAGSSISVVGEQSTSGMVVAGGQWSFSAEGEGNTLTVNRRGLSISDATVTLAGNVNVVAPITLDGTSALHLHTDVDMGSNTLTMANSTVAVGEGAKLTIGNVELTGMTVSHTGAAAAFATDGVSGFTLAGGTLTNKAGDTETHLSVAFDTTNKVDVVNNGKLNIKGTHTVGTLTANGDVSISVAGAAADGSITTVDKLLVGDSATVKVWAQLNVADETQISKNAFITNKGAAGAAFSVGESGYAVENGAVSTSASTVALGLSKVALTTNGDATISSAIAGGSVTSNGDTTITGTLADVALTANKNVTINGTQTLVSLTAKDTVAITDTAAVTVTGSVTLASGKAMTVGGSLKYDNLAIDGSTVTADGVVSLFSGSTGITGGSITDANADRIVNAALNVDEYIHNGSGTLTLNGTQTLGDVLSNNGTVAVNGTTNAATITATALTVDDGATAEVTGLTEVGALSGDGKLTTGSATVKGASTIKDLSSTGNVTVGSLTSGGSTSVGSLAVAGDAAVNTLTSTGDVTVGGTLDGTSVNVAGNVTVGGDVSVGSLTGATVTLNGAGNEASALTAVDSVVLGAGSKLTVGDLTADKISISSLNGIDADNHVFDVTGSLTSTGDKLVLGVDAATLKDLMFNTEKKSEIAGIASGAGAGVLFADGDQQVESLSDTDARRTYVAGVEDGALTITYLSTGNGWVADSGIWGAASGENEGFASSVDEKGDASFMGGGNSEVTVTGDKKVDLLNVDATVDDVYSFSGDDIEAGTLTVSVGGMKVGNEVTVNDKLAVGAQGTLTVESTGTLTIGDNAATDGSSITNNGTLNIGEGADLVLDGTGTTNNTGTATVAGNMGVLNNSGAVTIAGVGEENTSSIGTLKSTGSVTLAGNTTVGSLDNDGTITGADTKLTLENGTGNGGTVAVGTVDLNSKDQSFNSLTADSVVNNNASLTVGNATIGTLEGSGDVTAKGDVSITSATDGIGTLTTAAEKTVTLGGDTTIAKLDNNGTLAAGDSKITLANATVNGGTVTLTTTTDGVTEKAGTIDLMGNDHTFGSLTVGTVENNTSSLTVGGATIGTLNGAGDVTANGNVSIDDVVDGIGTLTAATGTTVTIATTAGNATIAIDTLAGSGAITAADQTLRVTGTAIGSAVELSTQVLDISGTNTMAYNFANLSITKLIFDAANLLDIPVPMADAADATDIDSLIMVAGDSTGMVLHQDLAAGLLAAGSYNVLSAGALTGDITLDDDTVKAYMREGLSAVVSVDADANVLVLDILDNAEAGPDDAIVWNTSKDEVTDPTTGATLALGTDPYDMLDNVYKVDVDADRTIDLTGEGVTPDTAAGLVVRNLTGDRTLTITGDGDDIVTLSNTYDSELEGTLALENLSATVAPANAGAALKVANVNLANASLNGGAAGDLTVGALTGDAGSSISGVITLVGDNALGNYAGTYDNATAQVSGKQEVTADRGLTVVGVGATDVALKGTGAAYTIGGFAVSGGNSSVTLVDAGRMPLSIVGQGVVADGATLTGNITLDGVVRASDAPMLTRGGQLDVRDATVALVVTDTSAISAGVDPQGATGNVVLARLGTNVLSAATTHVTLETDEALVGAMGVDFAQRFLKNVHLDGVNVVADIVTDYYSSKLDNLDETATVGAQMLDYAALEQNPQNNRTQHKDLAAVLDTMDKHIADHNTAAAARLAAAVGGSGVASMGIAFADDMDRQLRAIRNRTTTMGLAAGYVNEGLPYLNAWINAEGDYRTVEGSDTAAGYKRNSWGGTVGFDADLSQNLTVGVAVTAMFGNMSAESAEDTAEGNLDTTYVSVFGRYASRAWVHTFVASVGIVDATLDRTINCVDGPVTTSGTTDGMSIGLMYEVGRVIALDEDSTVCLQPVFNVAFKHTALGSYTETGDIGLRVGDQTLNTLTVGVGARIQATIGETMYNRSTLFEGRVLAKFDAGDRSSSADVALAHSTAQGGSVESAERGAAGLEVGVGLTVPVSREDGSLFFDASAELRSDYTNVNATVGYRINF